MKKYTTKRNTPTVTLIKNYTNKNSGKVVASRREIQRRFDHLDWNHQKKILMAFLDSIQTDREWAYIKLLDFWDKSFEPKVEELLEKYHEQKCSWSIIRHFPVSYLKENIDSFTGERDYFFICLRLAKEPDFVIDKDRLSKTDYLALIYHSERTISDEEALDILFGIVHDKCTRGITFDDPIRIYNHDEISAANLKDIQLAMSYLNKMDHIQAICSFENWDENVIQQIRQSPEYKILLESYDDDYSIRYWKIRIARKYAYMALDEKYKLPTDCMDEFLSSYDQERLIACKPSNSFPAKAKEPPMPFDLPYLNKLKQTNPAYNKLVELFDLEAED